MLRLGCSEQVKGSNPQSSFQQSLLIGCFLEGNQGKGKWQATQVIIGETSLMIGKAQRRASLFHRSQHSSVDACVAPTALLPAIEPRQCHIAE